MAALEVAVRMESDNSQYWHMLAAAYTMLGAQHQDVQTYLKGYEAIKMSLQLNPYDQDAIKLNNSIVSDLKNVGALR